MENNIKKYLKKKLSERDYNYDTVLTPDFKFKTDKAEPVSSEVSVQGDSEKISQEIKQGVDPYLTPYSVGNGVFFREDTVLDKDYGVVLDEKITNLDLLLAINVIESLINESKSKFSDTYNVLVNLIDKLPVDKLPNTVKKSLINKIYNKNNNVI